MLADQEASTSASLTRHAPALVAPADVGRLEAELGDKKVTHAPLFQVFAGRPASLSTAQLLLPILLAACVRGLRGLGGREGRCVGVWDVCILRVDPRRENLTVGIRRRARPLLASPLAGLRCRRASVRSLRPTRKSSAISWHVSRWCKLSLSPRAFSRPLPLAPPPPLHAVCTGLRRDKPPADKPSLPVLSLACARARAAWQEMLAALVDKQDNKTALGALLPPALFPCRIRLPLARPLA